MCNECLPVPASVQAPSLPRPPSTYTHPWAQHPYIHPQPTAFRQPCIVNWQLSRPQHYPTNHQPTQDSKFRPDARTLLRHEWLQHNRRTLRVSWRRNQGETLKTLTALRGADARSSQDAHESVQSVVARIMAAGGWVCTVQGTVGRAPAPRPSPSCAPPPHPTPLHT